MNEREKVIREEAEYELDLIKANPWRTEPTLKFKLEDVCHLLSIIGQLRAERDEIREAWDRVANYRGEETHLMYMCIDDLRKLAKLIGKE